jgi:thiosulfate/3-mercaptopyruvate sulfurtransferase
MKRTWLIAGLLLIGALRADAQRADTESMIVSPAWLATHLTDPSVVVVDIEHEPGAYATGHIPGARFLSYMDLIVSRGGISTELPSVDSLRAVLERAGVSSGSHVVVYSSLAPMAARAFFTLDYLGNVRVSFLDGGLTSWQRAGHTVTTAVASVRRGSFTPHPRPDAVVDAAWVQAHTGTRGVALIDTRTDGEYAGAGERHGMPSAGHVAGARQLQWEQLFSNARASELLPRSELAKLYAARATSGDTVVTYCYVGYRASVTYMVARLLGYPTRLYDGSYEDWSQRRLPVVSGISPKTGER